MRDPENVLGAFPAWGWLLCLRRGTPGWNYKNARRNRECRGQTTGLVFRQHGLTVLISYCKHKSTFDYCAVFVQSSKVPFLFFREILWLYFLAAHSSTQQPVASFSSVSGSLQYSQSLYSLTISIQSTVSISRSPFFLKNLLGGLTPPMPRVAYFPRRYRPGPARWPVGSGQPRQRPLVTNKSHDLSADRRLLVRIIKIVRNMCVVSVQIALICPQYRHKPGLLPIMTMPGREHPTGTVHTRLRVWDCYPFHGRPGACVSEKFRVVNQIFVITLKHTLQKVLWTVNTKIRTVRVQRKISSQLRCIAF